MFKDSNYSFELLFFKLLLSKKFLKKKIYLKGLVRIPPLHKYEIGRL